MAEFRGESPLDAPPAAVFAAVADLATYPDWLSIVGRAAPVAEHADDPGPAWSVELQARLGPLVRRKALRMVRTVYEPDRHVRFERVEHDGKRHGSWVLSATLSEGPPVQLAMLLSYSGMGWVPGLDLLLAGEARRAGRRLEDRLKRHANPD